MKRNEFNQGVSFKVFIHDHQKADLTSTIFLRIIIDRKKKEFNLKVSWPREFFDQEKQEVRPRFARDQEAAGINMIINEAKGRAHRIKLRYFTQGKALSLALFQKEFENYESRDNLLFYWQQKIESLYAKGNITNSTKIRQETNRRRFSEFAGGDFFSMADLNRELILQYKNWLLKKKKLAHNTSTQALKGLQTYINHAIDEGYHIQNNAFKNISLRYQQGERCVLEKDEVLALMKLLGDDLQETEREVLRKFLFSCFTGLRISDSAAVTSSMIRGNKIRVPMVKGLRFGKEVEIPLPRYAMELIAGRRGKLFEQISDQKCNAWLKVLAHKAGIKKRLTFHVSRDTFATLFIEMGGDVATLRELMGHEDIKTTQIYIKITDGHKEASMARFNEF